MRGNSQNTLLLLQFAAAIALGMANAVFSTYKRDQVEQAIGIVSGNIRPRQLPEAFNRLKIELKRLLDRDRKQAHETPKGTPVRQAFHSGPPPGRGIDVIYTAYEAFALLIALRLMRGGLPQSTAVRFLRDLREPLAGFHYETLQTSPEQIQSAKSPYEPLILIRDGFLAEEAEKMAYLVAQAGELAEEFQISSPIDTPVSGNICRDLKSLHERLVWGSHLKNALIIVELVNAAHQLAYHLNQIPPRSRGRS